MHVNALSKALIELTEDESIWPGEHQDERLRMAFVQFTSECKKHGVSDLVTRSSGHMLHMEVCTKDYGFCLSTNPHSGNRGQIFSVLLGSSLLKFVFFFLKWTSHVSVLRKQMYPLGKGNYPTLVQKHFNGAVSCWQSCAKPAT